MFQVTGNEYISLPEIHEDDGAVMDLSFLYMQAKGMLEMSGDNGLLCPYVSAGDANPTGQIHWFRHHAWIPEMMVENERIKWSCVYLAPLENRGFVLHLHAENCSDEVQSIRLGVKGSWDHSYHRVNESFEMTEGRSVKRSEWNHMFIFRQGMMLPLYAFAPICSDDSPFGEFHQGEDWSINDFHFDIGKNVNLKPGESDELNVYFGIGYEEVAATTSAKEMLRHGYAYLLQTTEKWLDQRERHLSDAKIQELLNTNLFFCFFFASGRCLDTEELCLVTSRSPRYYVSAAYWDRDSLLWAFPAILAVDREYAKEILQCVFTRQARNFGIHSRFIDGTVLEPGFELDELCAPVIALEKYVDQTGDVAFAQEGFVQEALRDILHKLGKKKDDSTGLYETFLQPTDDMRIHPYLTYDNVLVWKVMKALSVFLKEQNLSAEAEKLREAICSHCVKNVDGEMQFVWSVDGKGKYDIYDEPPGSLQLLPFYGFCDAKDPRWLACLKHIRDEKYPLSFAGHPIAEIGCKHAPHPWVLSICNSLLSGHQTETLMHLQHAMMDNGIACESVHEDSGECTTGAAFATCAGFLSYALMQTVCKGGR